MTVALCAAAYMVASGAAEAGPPDWNKAGTSPAITAAPSTITTTPATSTMAPSTLAPKPTLVSPASSKANSTLAPKAAVTASTATPTSGDLFKLDDRAIIVVGGKPVTAGSVKAQMDAAFKAKAGQPKVAKANARKLDLGTMNVMSSPGAGGLGARASVTALANGKGATLLTPKPGLGAKAATQVNNGTADAFAKSQCTDKGPPNLLEVGGKLVSNGRVTLTGYCFGDKPGRVEVLGQFAGGKLVPAFSAWDKTSITIDIPTSHGVGDGNVVVTVVTAENKTSNAVQAAYVATRERIEVPDRMWDGGGRFELSSTTVTSDTTKGTNAVNPAASGSLAKRVRLNPQCALDNMDVTSYAGSATSIDGFENGPPNEANVTVGWQGTCLGTETIYTYQGIFSAGAESKMVSACRVTLQLRAWAYCTVGVAP